MHLGLLEYASISSRIGRTNEDSCDEQPFYCGRWEEFIGLYSLNTDHGLHGDFCVSSYVISPPNVYTMNCTPFWTPFSLVIRFKDNDKSFLKITISKIYLLNFTVIC